MKRLQAALWAMVLVLAAAPAARAQYHLDELGVRLGGGTNVPTPFRQNGAGNLPEDRSPWRLGLAYNVDGFWSHYFCGKESGYHLEIGARGYWLGEDRDTRPGLASNLPGFSNDSTSMRNRVSQHYAQVGFYFKIRRFNYHRAIETCFMAGPKLNVRVSGRLREIPGGPTRLLTDYDGMSQNTFIPGLQASVWFRRKFGKNMSCFLIPSLDVYFGRNLENAFGQGFASLYPSVNFGITFWSNK